MSGNTNTSSLCGRLFSTQHMMMTIINLLLWKGPFSVALSKKSYRFTEVLTLFLFLGCVNVCSLAVCEYLPQRLGANFTASDYASSLTKLIYATNRHLGWDRNTLPDPQLHWVLQDQPPPTDIALSLAWLHGQLHPNVYIWGAKVTSSPSAPPSSPQCSTAACPAMLGYLSFGDELIFCGLVECVRAERLWQSGQLIRIPTATWDMDSSEGLAFQGSQISHIAAVVFCIVTSGTRISAVKNV